jgi:hypothetical protein
MGQSVRPREGSSILNVAHTPGRLDRYVQPADPLVAYNGSGADCAFDIQNNAVPRGAAAPAYPAPCLGGLPPQTLPRCGAAAPQIPALFRGAPLACAIRAGPNAYSGGQRSGFTEILKGPFGS